VKALTLTAVCSSRPNRTRNWKVTNPNAKAVAVSWSLAGTTQKGTLLAAPRRQLLRHGHGEGHQHGYHHLGRRVRGGSVESAVSIKDECTARQSFDVAAEGGVRVQPNPARDAFTVVLPAAVAGPVQVQITDMRGRLFTQVQETVPGGGHALRFTTAQLPAGLYLIRVVPANGRREVRKLQVIK
jgi:hypothetical protein